MMIEIIEVLFYFLDVFSVFKVYHNYT